MPYTNLPAGRDNNLLRSMPQGRQARSQRPQGQGLMGMRQGQMQGQMRQGQMEQGQMGQGQRQMGQRQEQLELQKARLKAEQAQLKYQEELLIWQQKQAQRMKLSQLLGARRPREQGRGLSQMMRGM